MNERILPIKYPDITSLPVFANINAILSVDETVYQPWFCQNHVQLVGWSDPDVYIQFFNPLFRKNYNLFNLYHVPKRIFSGIVNFIEVIVEELNNGNYIYLSIDKYYISSYLDYKKYHSSHDMLIYGYNREEERFFIADFFKSRYEFSTTTFSELKDAFMSSHSEGDWFKGIQILEKNNKDYRLEVGTLVKHLTDYVEMNNSSLDYVLVEKPNSDTDYWGIGVYTLLSNSLVYNPVGSSLLRSAHLLWDHKCAMLERIKLLHSQGFISEPDDYKELFIKVEKRMLVIRNLILKQTLFPNKSMEYIKTITRLLKDNISDEEKGISTLIKDIRNNTPLI